MIKTGDIVFPANGGKQVGKSTLQEDLEDLQILNGTGGETVTKESLGLGNVNNTSDAAKPISTAQQAALDNKADASAVAAALALKLDDSQLDTDSAMAANSDSRIPTQKAVKTAIAAANSSALPSIPSLNLTNFKPSQFNSFRKKVGGMRAGTGARPMVMVSGDSTTRGYTIGAAGEYAHRPSKYMAKALTAAGIPAADNSLFGITTADDPGIVYSGSGWNFSNPGGVLGGAWVENNTNLSTITYTPEIAWDRCEIHYVNFGNAKINIAIGGNAPTTGPASYTPNGGTTQGRVIVGSSAAAVQSLVLSKEVAGDFAAVNGPIRFWNSANPGIDVVCNGGGGYTAGYGSANGAFFVLDAVVLAQPDIVFVNYGTNDWFGDTVTNFNNYETQLTTIATIIQGYGGQVILVAPPPVLEVNDAQTQNYLTKMRAVSVAKNCPMLNFYDRFDRNTTGPFTWYNGVHGVKEMYVDIGYVYAEVIKLLISG